MNLTKILRSVSSQFMFATALVAMASSAALASSIPQGTFDRTLQVSGPVDLEVFTHSGDITVRTWSSGSVQIHGKIYVNHDWFGRTRDVDVHEIEQNPPIRQEGNSVHIDYVNVREVSVDYEITVPADTTIRTQSGSGDQILEGTHGNVDVRTGSGNVRLNSIAGEIRLQTGSGDVRGREISGPIRGGAGSGDIEIEETGSGDIDLHTGSGNVTVRGIQGGFHAEAGSGDITAEGTQSGSWELRTGSGNIHVRLPGSAAFDADISTSSGTIDVESPIEMTVQGRINERQRHIQGKVRGGGPLLSVRTGSGDIHIQ